MSSMLSTAVSEPNTDNGTFTKESLELTSIPLNCTPASIDEFPADIFTQSDRRHGWVILHGLVSLYIFYSLALVCDEYFVPCIESICSGE